MDANQIKQQFPGYAGWNDPAAIMADFKATGGQGKGGGATQSGGGNTDYTALARQQMELQKEANQPAVQSLQAQIPEIQQGYAQQKTALESQKGGITDRYKAIIDQLKGKQELETTQQSTALSQEYGKRGVPLSSGIFQQDLMGKTQGISQNYAGLTSTAQLGENQDQLDLANKIAGLPSQQTAEERQVMNAIAQLQSGGASNAITQALQQYQFQQQEKRLQETAQATSANDSVANALKNLTYQQTTLPESQATVAYKKAETAKTLKDLRESSGGGVANYYNTPATTSTGAWG